MQVSLFPISWQLFLAEFSSLLYPIKTSRDMEGNVPSRSPLSFGHFQKSLQALLSFAGKVY
jgi:hypothetical protein